MEQNYEIDTGVTTITLAIKWDMYEYILPLKEYFIKQANANSVIIVL